MDRARILLDRRAAGFAASRTDVLVLVTLGQNEQQALAHRDRDTASRTGEQCRLQPLESRLFRLLSHRRCSFRIIATAPAAAKLVVAGFENRMAGRGAGYYPERDRAFLAPVDVWGCVTGTSGFYFRHPQGALNVNMYIL